MGTIYLIRHGQASFGKADYDRLSATGEQQARVLGKSLKRRLDQLDAVICGDMLRHRQTAAGCLEGLGLKRDPATDARWNEYDHEEVILRYKPAYRSRVRLMADMARTLNPKREFQAMFTRAVERWASGEHDHEYAESWPVFCARVESALRELVDKLGPSRTALVFTSGGPITAACRYLLNIEDEHIFNLNWTLANAAVTKLIYSDRGIYLSTLNEHSHFEGAHRELITYR